MRGILTAKAKIDKIAMSKAWSSRLSQTLLKLDLRTCSYFFDWPLRGGVRQNKQHKEQVWRYNFN